MRIQHRRSRGWRMPDGAVYVGRTTRGRRHQRLSDTGGITPTAQIEVVSDRADAVDLVRALVSRPESKVFLIEARGALAGRDLVCWCPLSDPCHADVLLELVNSSLSGSNRSEGS